MNGHSWIHPPSSNVLFGRTANLVPIKMTNVDILELPGNHMMYNSRRDALEDMYKDINEMTLVAILKELFGEKALQWENKTSLWQYAQSRIAIVIGPPMILLMVPYIKLRYNMLRKYIAKEHPEWEI